MWRFYADLAWLLNWPMLNKIEGADQLPANVIAIMSMNPNVYVCSNWVSREEAESVMTDVSCIMRCRARASGGAARSAGAMLRASDCAGEFFGLVS